MKQFKFSSNGAIGIAVTNGKEVLSLSKEDWDSLKPEDRIDAVQKLIDLLAKQP